MLGKVVSIAGEAIRFGNGTQPDSVVAAQYRRRMAENLKVVVRDNVRTLLGLKPRESGVQRLIDLGISNGNAQRVLKGETSIGIDLLAQLAKVLDVQPWQLCVRHLDPENLPTLHVPSTRWPFRKVDHDVVAGLVGTVAANVENGLLAALATAGVSPKKEPNTGT